MNSATYSSPLAHVFTKTTVTHRVEVVDRQVIRLDKLLGGRIRILAEVVDQVERLTVVVDIHLICIYLHTGTGTCSLP